MSFTKFLLWFYKATSPLFIAMKTLSTYLMMFIGCCAFFAIPDVLAIGDITDTSFEINVWDFTPGWASFISGNTEETVDNVLINILDKLLIVFGAFAVLIMTVWAWYMIIYHGQDEFLSKWKSIFMSWVIALVVALSAGVLVQLFAYLLYS